MEAEEIAKFDQLKKSNDEREELLSHMGFGVQEGNLRSIAFLEVITEHIGIRPQAEMRFQQLREKGFDELEPLAEAEILRRQQLKDLERRNAVTERLGIKAI